MASTRRRELVYCKHCRATHKIDVDRYLDGSAVAYCPVTSKRLYPNDRKETRG